MNLVELIREPVRRVPGRTALRVAGQEMTYGQVGEAVERCAAHLCQRGVGPGDSVALLDDCSPLLLAAILGAARIGAAAVPIHVELQLEELADRLAREKARAVHAPGQFTLGGDTVVALGRRMLPKAESDEEVADCLRLLSGRAHQVLTGISVIAPDGRQSVRVVTARVVLKRLTDEDVARYVACRDGIGKAGGYAIQGPAAALIKSINGSYTAIVGLPLYEAVSMLEGLGYRRDAAR